MLPMYHFTSSSQKVTKSTGFLSSSCIEQIWFHVINTAVLLWTLLQWILHLNLSLVYFIFYTFQSALLLKSQHLFPFWAFSPLYIWFLISDIYPKNCYLKRETVFLPVWMLWFSANLALFLPTLMNWTTGVKTLQKFEKSKLSKWCTVCLSPV